MVSYTNFRVFMALSLVATYASAAVLNLGAPVNAGGLSKRAPGQVITKCTVPGTVALTFDDGPWDNLRAISDTLTQHGARGTFYFNGNNLRCIYNEVMASNIQHTYGAGHQIASHTYSHANLTTLNFEEVHDEFWLVEEALYRITGAYTAFVRPPFGEFNSVVEQVALQRGQTITNWDFDSRDTSAPGVPGAQTLATFRSVIATKPSNILALMHEITPSTAEVLPQVITELQAAGYKLVTVAECLGAEPYQFVDEPQAEIANRECVPRR